MKPDKFLPSLYSTKQKELTLSGKALGKLMSTVLDKGVPFRFRVKGFSMSPFIKDDDVITVSPIGSNFPLTGSIVAFTHPDTGKIQVHRIIKKKGELCLIKGDNVLFTDGYIQQKYILGIVTGIMRKGKKKSFVLGPMRLLITFFSQKWFYRPFLNRLRKFLKKKG